MNKDLVKDTFIYTATDTFGKAIGFLLLPLVSFYLSPDELGIATNFTVLTSIVTLLAGEALVNSLPYFFYEQNKKQNTKLISNLLIMCTIACLCFLLLLLCIQKLIFQHIKIDITFQALAILSVFLHLFSNANFILLRLENKARQFASIQLVQIFFHCFFVILFVIIWKLGGKGKIFSEILPVFLLFFVHITMLVKKGYFRLYIDKENTWRLLKFGLPLLPHSLSFWLKGGMDKVFITTYCGLYQNGLFSMAITITSLYTIVRNAFFKAYTPYLQKRLAEITSENERQEKLKIVKQIYFFFGIFFIIAIGAIIGGWIILHYVVDAKYQESFKFLPWLILGMYIYAIYSFTIEFIYKQKKTLVMGLITFSGSIVQMGLSYFLIRNIGIMGAVYSSVVGTLIVSFAIFTYSNRVYSMPWFSVFKK